MIEHYDETHVERQGVDEVEDVVVDSSATRNASVIRLQEALYLLFGIIEVLIAVRFVLRAFGANPAAPFAAAIYAVTGPLIAPFNGMFGQPQLSQSVFEPQCVIAIIIYALLGWAIAKMIWLIGADTRDRSTTARTVTTEREHDHDVDHHLAA